MEKSLILKFWFPQRNERREREQRELVKKLREETLAENYSDAMYDESHSEDDSSSTNESYYEVRNRWHSAEDIHKVSIPAPKLRPSLSLLLISFCTLPPHHTTHVHGNV